MQSVILYNIDLVRVCIFRMHSNEKVWCIKFYAIIRNKDFSSYLEDAVKHTVNNNNSNENYWTKLKNCTVL